MFKINFQGIDEIDVIKDMSINYCVDLENDNEDKIDIQIRYKENKKECELYLCTIIDSNNNEFEFNTGELQNLFPFLLDEELKSILLRYFSQKGYKNVCRYSNYITNKIVENLIDKKIITDI